MLLALETTTDVFSAALGLPGRDPEIYRVPGKRHSGKLIPAIEELLGKHGSSPKDLKALGASVGPGSFTGIRVGLSCAITIAQVCGIPLYGVSPMDIFGRTHARSVIKAFGSKYYSALYGKGGMRLGPYSLIDEAERKLNGGPEVTPDAGLIFEEACRLHSKGDRGDWRDINPIYVMETVYRKKKSSPGS